MNKERRNARVRLAVQLLVVINMALTLSGKNPIPVDETALGDWLSIGLTGVMSIWTWWKDAPMTENALKAKTYHRALKEDGEYPICYKGECDE